jgi:hypothetical protein
MIGAVLTAAFVLAVPALVLGILALIFGIIGAARARRGQATNRTAALSGLWTGVGATLVSVVHIVVLIVWASQPVEVESGAGSDYLAEAGDTVTYEDGLLMVVYAPEASADGAFVTVTAQLTNDGEDGVGLDGGELVAYADGDELDADQVRLTGSEPGTLDPGETDTLTYTVTIPGGSEELGLDYAPSGDHDPAYWVFGLQGLGGGAIEDGPSEAA